MELILELKAVVGLDEVWREGQLLEHMGKHKNRMLLIELRQKD